MTFIEFSATLEEGSPPSRLSDTLQSLWWDKAHTIAQSIPTKQGSAVHAYLHREEGVLWNADYWYARAGRPRPSIPLDQEWRQLVDEMLTV